MPNLWLVAMKKFRFGEMEFQVPDGVYEAGEDSFLLARFVAPERGASVLDLGCGAGLVSVLAAKQGARVIAADINQKALDAAKENAKAQGVAVETRLTDLFTQIPEKFDYIYFNPPYLPKDYSSEALEEYLEKGEIQTWDGGVDGRELIDRFLDDFRGHLKPKGQAFLVNSSFNKIFLTKRALEKTGLKWEVAAEENLFFEKLYLFHMEVQ